MKNKFVPIQTELGFLSGRDCIFLDKVIFKNGQNDLVLEGEINGNLCSKEKRAGVFIPYKIKFSGILALKMIELDSWDFNSKSSFDEIIESSWIKKLGGKVESIHHHYLFQTYDEVFEIVCNDFKFVLKSKNLTKIVKRTQ